MGKLQNFTNLKQGHLGMISLTNHDSSEVVTQIYIYIYILTVYLLEGIRPRSNSKFISDCVYTAVHTRINLYTHLNVEEELISFILPMWRTVLQTMFCEGMCYAMRLGYEHFEILDFYG